MREMLLSNKELLKLTVEKEHLNFDLEKFMKKEGASSGAVVLMTPKQIVATDCFVRRELDPTYGEHGFALEAISNAVYADYGVYNTSYNLIWQAIALADGNIFMQLCTDCSSIIWIPEVISISQYNSLLLFNEKIKEIYSNNKEYFDLYPMAFISNLREDKEDLNNIDTILEIAKGKIGNVNLKMETIVGDNIQQLNYSLDDSELSSVRRIYR